MPGTISVWTLCAAKLRPTLRARGVANRLVFHFN